ncbi:hypothetical protein [Alteromonas sp. ASW11-130]|uniref:hypothetical protein n=1 Tax=Alteromonas sp. ASW11-130 TaxID=3015775 RepID=UPI0022424424|nr:hypothetical protein [Alteromonas sp. ASW11-130]MCW8092123.1 hypothetical protein [Alteromonas sp. ASW11-130]
MSDETTPELKSAVHEANKREAFDGMRAYHQSEIAHKKDAVDILKAILTTTIVLYGGVLSVVISGNIDNSYAIYTGWTLVVLIGLSVALVVGVTNRKIDEDNKRYRKYRDEYVLERKLLGLESDLLNENYTSAWIEEHYPTKTGYHHTKNILRVFAAMIFFVSLVGSAFIYGAKEASNNSVQQGQAAAPCPTVTTQQPAY